jgi:hypothetical protein
LRTSGSSRWKSNIAPQRDKKNSTKSKIDIIQSSSHLFQKRMFHELKETKGIGRFLGINKNKVDLHTSAYMQKSINKRQMEDFSERMHALKWY